MITSQLRGTVSQTITVTHSSSISLGLKDPESIVEGKFGFDSGVQKSSTYTLTAEKDVFLGQIGSIYCDPNFDNPTFFGFNKSTGSVDTHFAFIIKWFKKNLSVLLFWVLRFFLANSSMPKSLIHCLFKFLHEVFGFCSYAAFVNNLLANFYNGHESLS